MLFIHCFIIVYDFINASMKSKGKENSPRVLTNGSQLHVPILKSNLKGKDKGPIVTSKTYLSWNKEIYGCCTCNIIVMEITALCICF